MNMNDALLSKLKESFVVTENDTGKDASLSAKGMHFTLRTYEVKDLGHLCLLDMKAMFGLMKMETAVLSAETIDMPLFNLDRISVMKKHTQLIEFYDTLLEPQTAEAAACFERIRNADARLADYESGEHWYDSILLPYSYMKTSRGALNRFDMACRSFMGEYIRQTETAPVCVREEKQKKTFAFAKGLLDAGGPAVDLFRKLFGEETTERLVLHHMYGVK
ncbi:MAG: hypothetical protein K6G61_04360 [Solobacterium sp.]|nr:hypothetical protein [Solobacterium sp.]